MRYLTFINATLFLLIGIVACDLRAQDSTKVRPTLSINVASGLDGGFRVLAGTLDGDMRMQYRDQLFIAQAHFTRETWPWGPETNPPKEAFFSYQFLYGRRFPFHLSHGLFPFFPFSLSTKEEADYFFSVAVGVGKYEYTLRDPDTWYSFQGDEPGLVTRWYKGEIWTVPIQIEIVKVLGSSFGYVHRFYYTINDRRNTYGLLWGLEYTL